MPEMQPTSRWRAVASDPMFRIGFWAGLAAGVVAAYVTRLIDLLAALALDGLLLAWTELGPVGVPVALVALVWLTDLYLWGADCARINNNSRNPLLAIFYGTLGWAYVLLSILFSPLMLLRRPAESVEERARRIWQRVLWRRLGTRPVAG